jgi:hypothetical protein
MFSLPAKQASRRVEIWRKLKRYGAVALRSSGYLLPSTPENLEHFEWLAAAIRKYRGHASVVHVNSIDDLPSQQLAQLFIEARSRDYEGLRRDLNKTAAHATRSSAHLARLHRRFQEILAIDYFHSPLRHHVERLLAHLDQDASSTPVPLQKRFHPKKGFQRRTWLTRPRPGIDRVASAWLIRRFIDRKARFRFASDASKLKDGIPFDMFGDHGFGHRGDDCTFETLCKEFGIRDPRVKSIAQIIHDADLEDDKFGRREGWGIDRILAGWARTQITDEAILRRGMELIDGLYRSLS